jgi:sec-independent protein translocase protein TatA
LKIFRSTIPDLRRIFAQELTLNTTFMLSTLLFLGNLGAGEIFLVIALFVLFFGAKKIPELAKGIGRGIREFKDASKDIKDTIEEESRKQS